MKCELSPEHGGGDGGVDAAFDLPASGGSSGDECYSSPEISNETVYCRPTRRAALSQKSLLPGVQR